MEINMHTRTHREKGRERGRETNVPIVACPLVLCTYSETRGGGGRQRRRVGGRENEVWHSAGNNPARMSESNQASKSLAEKPKASESLL